MFETDTNEAVAMKQLQEKKGLPSYKQEFGAPPKRQRLFKTRGHVKMNTNPIGHVKKEFTVKRHSIGNESSETKHSKTPGFIQGIINQKRSAIGQLGNQKQLEAEIKPNQSKKAEKHSRSPPFIRGIIDQKKAAIGQIGQKKQLEAEIKPKNISKETKHSTTPSFIRGTIAQKAHMKSKILDFGNKRR